MRSIHRRRLAPPGAALLALVLLTMMGWSRAAWCADAAPHEPLARVLGIAPGMSEARAHRLLTQLGERLQVEQEAEQEGESRTEREIWRLHSPQYAWVQLAVDEHHRVKALQAHLRPGGPGLRYDQIGDVEAARRLGFTILEWVVPARAGRVGRRVTARGGDPVFAESVAITEND